MESNYSGKFAVLNLGYKTTCEVYNTKEEAIERAKMTSKWNSGKIYVAEILGFAESSVVAIWCDGNENE